MVDSLTTVAVWETLGQIADPEIPVLSVVELGVVRAVRVAGREVQVELTPTFSACPAYQYMVEKVRAALRELGAEEIQLITVFDPPWTTDWLSDEAREKLRRFGLATPPRHHGKLSSAIEEEPVACPYCGSTNTRLTNPFGSSSCRAISFCDGCNQPFEQLKPL